nr:hypothetical protein [Bradyrhizobium sp. Ec3.3]
MARPAIIGSDSLWQEIGHEARRATADPVFGAAISDSILAHHDFAAALSDLIGRRLGGNAATRARFAKLANDAFRGEPDLVEAASRAAIAAAALQASS